MNIFGRGAPKPPEPDKDSKKPATSFLQWGSSWGMKVTDITSSTSKSLSGLANSCLNKVINQYGVSQPLPEELQTLRQQLQNKTGEHEITPDDPLLKSSWTEMERLLNKKLKTATQAEGDYSPQFKRDSHHLKSLAVTVTFPGKPPLSSSELDTQDLIKMMAAKSQGSDRKALSNVLSELCSQSPFNPLANLIQQFGQVHLSNDMILSQPDDCAKTCHFRCQPDEIAIDLSMEVPRLTAFPVESKSWNLAEVDAKVTLKAQLKLPVNEPDKVSLEAMTMSIGDVSGVRVVDETAE